MISTGDSLEGYLVGIGVRHADGTEKFTWLDDPIHNTIVSSGVDHMLRWNGGDNFIRDMSRGDRQSHIHSAFFLSGIDSNCGAHRGIFYKMAIGTGSSKTTPDMTNLESIISNETTAFSTEIKTGSPYTGTHVVGNGKYQFRITHYSIKAQDDYVVSEFGLFGETSSSSPMFCRVVIPENIRPTLHAGEQLMLTYQLNWNNEYSGDTPHDIGNLNISDADGNNIGICAEARNYTLVYSIGAGTGFNMLNCPLSVNPNGYDGNSAPYNTEIATLQMPVWYFDTLRAGTGNSPGPQSGYADMQYAFEMMYSTVSKDFPSSMTTLDTANLTLNANNSTDNNLSAQIFVKPYTAGSGYRDYQLHIANNRTSDTNMYYMRHRGIDYKFYRMVDGEKVYSPLVIKQGDVVILNFRVSYATPA